MSDLVERLRDLDRLCRADGRTIRTWQRIFVEAADEIEDLRTSVIAFCGPFAAQYAKDHRLPPNHLHPTHYDILAKAGARMDDFVRSDAFSGSACATSDA